MMMRLLLPFSLLFALAACRREEITFPVTPAKPAPTTTADTTKPGTSTVITQSIPYGLDEYEPFSLPFAASATNRLKKIDVFREGQLVAQSLFMYDNVSGRLSSRVYAKQPQYGTLFRRTETYIYDTEGRLFKEAFLLNDGFDAGVVYKDITYTYQGALRLSAVQRTNQNIAPRPLPLTLNSRISYSYAGADLITRNEVNYYSAVGTVNTPTPQDSTKRAIRRMGNTTSLTDSTWSLLCPGGVAGCRPSLRATSGKRFEYDSNGNAVSIQAAINDGNQSSTPSVYTFQHSYNGPDGLLSRSVNLTLGLTYVFTYEAR